MSAAAAASSTRLSLNQRITRRRTRSASKPRNRFGTEITHCRTGTGGLPDRAGDLVEVNIGEDPHDHVLTERAG
jgi:hypothetical protein